MKYKILLIIDNYQEDLFEKLNNDYLVDCLDNNVVLKANKNNVNYINYHEYISDSKDINTIVSKLDEFREYSFIISNEKLKSSKSVNILQFLKWDKVPSQYQKQKLNLLINGHDLKFIKGLFALFQKDFNLIIIENSDYLIVDKEKCSAALKKADIIWCEWLTSNACWFSENVKSYQKLIIRAHRFEINKNYGYKLKIENVNKIITVGYYYYEEFIKKFNFPRYKVTIIPNFIDVAAYDQNKNKNAKYNLALIGAIPKIKGLHRAIKIIFELKKVNPNYKLHVLGLKPTDLTSTNYNKEEVDYFQNILHNIKVFNLEENVIFTGWVDVKKYLKKIGYVLSVSDLESFHIAPFEGLASGSLALALPRPGIEYIYPAYVIKKDEQDIVKTILALENNDNQYNKLVNNGREFVKDNYDLKVVYKYIIELLRGEYEEKNN